MGECAGCDVPWVCNVCHVEFCIQYSDIIMSRFPSVKTVIPVLTQDTGVEKIVQDNLSTIVCPLQADKEYNSHVIKKWILDWHPDISCFIKMFSNRDQTRLALYMNKKYSWNQVRHARNIAYVLDDHFKYVDRITHKLGFRNEVIEPGFNLPEQMIWHNEQGAPIPVVVSYNPSFLPCQLYTNSI